MRRTNVEILVDTLKRIDGNQASERRLAELTGWSSDKVRRIVQAAATDRIVEIQIGRGGVVQFRGSEVVSANGLYSDVARVVERYWGPQQLGLRNILTVETSRAGRRGQGVWSHPDLVLLADPRRRSSLDELPRTHSIEVEIKAGFDLRSVYQAHAQGRGADYSWVFGNKTPGVERSDWERIYSTAEELGVGLVTFDRAGSWTTWRHYLDARHRKPKATDREEFLDLALGAKLRQAHGV